MTNCSTSSTRVPRNSISAMFVVDSDGQVILQRSPLSPEQLELDVRAAREVMRTGQAAWGDPVSDGLTQAPVYLCQFGTAVSAYSFRQHADGHWEGLGPLEGWNVIAQEDGLVARNSDQLLVIGEGPDSLVQGGQVVQGECADARDALPQLSGSGDPGDLPLNPEAGELDEPRWGNLRAHDRQATAGTVPRPR